MFGNYLNQHTYEFRLQRGSVSVIAVLSMVALLGFVMFGVDAGWVYYNQMRLQAAMDAAAMAGAEALWSQTWTAAKTQAGKYTAEAGVNSIASHGVTVTAPVYTAYNYPQNPLPASGAKSGANAIQVSQTATVPLFFGPILGWNTKTIKAISTATAGGGGNQPQYNVEIVIDTTASMGTNDPSSQCKTLTTPLGISNPTRFQCAAAGALTLLQGLTNTGNSVGLMTFPPMTSSSNVSCSGSSVSGLNSIASSYSASGLSYQLVSPGNGKGYLSGSNLNTSNPLVQALGGGSCQLYSNGQPPGGLGTFYAQAIAAAQAALPSTGNNAIVMISDGQASSSQTQLGNTYKSTYNTECQAAISAATTAKNNGTTIYTVQYAGGGSPPTCSDGSDSMSTCQALYSVASAGDFYSDTCPSTGSYPANASASNLKAIFQQIAYSLTSSRLVPNINSTASVVTPSN
jgi:hypothetical protein